MTDSEILAQAIIQNGWYETGDFTLSSGVKSNFYIDLRPCMLSTRYIHLLTINLQNVLINQVRLTVDDLLCGVVTSGLFLAGAMLQKLSVVRECSAIYCRTEHRQHGQKRHIEGQYKEGQEVIILDDVATSGSSIQKVAIILRQRGLKVKAAVVVVDRQEGAKERLAVVKIPLYSALTLEMIREMDAKMDDGRGRMLRMGKRITR